MHAYLVISRVVELPQRRHWKQGAELAPVAFEMFQDLFRIRDGVDLKQDTGLVGLSFYGVVLFTSRSMAA